MFYSLQQTNKKRERIKTINEIFIISFKVGPNQLYTILAINLNIHSLTIILNQFSQTLTETILCHSLVLSLFSSAILTQSISLNQFTQTLTETILCLSPVSSLCRSLSIISYATAQSHPTPLNP